MELSLDVGLQPIHLQPVLYSSFVTKEENDIRSFGVVAFAQSNQKCFHSLVALVKRNPGFYGNTSAFHLKTKRQTSSCDWRKSSLGLQRTGILSIGVILFVLGTFLDDDVIVGLNQVDLSNS